MSDPVSPLRIVMVSSSYIDVSVGGVESHVYEISRALLLRGHKVLVVRTGPGESIRQYRTDVPLVVLRSDGTAKQGQSIVGEALRRVTRGLRSAIGRLPPGLTEADIVHFHDLLEAAPLAARIAMTSRKKLFWTNHLGEFLILARSSWGRALLRVLTRPYEGATAPSMELARQDALHPPIRFLSNGFDPERFRPRSPAERGSLRKRMGMPDGRTIVLVPRRWAPTKGVSVMAEALAGWSEAPQELLVLFVSGGATNRYSDYQRQVMEHLERSAVEHRVVPHASPEEMPDYYAIADITVIPSLLEAVSLSALESLGTGIPVLGTRVGGFLDLESDGAEGLILVRPGDVQGLRSALLNLASSLRTYDEDRAREIAQCTAANYSWAAVALRLEGLYAHLASP